MSRKHNSPILSVQEAVADRTNASAEGFGQSLASLAAILLRRGVTVHEFARWAETAFVNAAVELLKDQGKDASYSRISALTGLHRHAVSDILGGLGGNRTPGDASKEYERNRLARVLTGWFEDPKFTTEEGRPKRLRIDGAGSTFSGLVREYSGDIYPGIILDELERVGAVKRHPDGSVEAISRRYTRGGADEESLHHAELVTADVLRTIEHNTRAEPNQRFYEDAAVAANLPADVVPVLSRMLERRAAAFLDDLEGWLASQETAATDKKSTQDRVRAGVRVVMVVEPDPDVADEKKQR
jgi:hypothetical protein